jgi:hypothetical protein
VNTLNKDKNRGYRRFGIAPTPYLTLALTWPMGQFSDAIINTQMTTAHSKDIVNILKRAAILTASIVIRLV